MNNNFFGFASMLIIAASQTLPLLAQTGGDQFLDGIGETALVARYVFNGNERDASRNAFHGRLQGLGRGNYVVDSQFGQALSLTGNKAYVQIPGQALEGLDTISVSAWVQLRSGQTPQSFFSFGKNTNSEFFCWLVPFRAGITKTGANGLQGPSASALPTNRWAHIAVVLDAANRRMSCYLDGVRIAQATGVTLTMEQIIDQDDGSANHLLIGPSQIANDPTLNALIRDFRIYSIALSDQQVATICKNAGKEVTTSIADTGGQTNQPAKPRGIAQPMADKLTGVPDVSVETTVGTLPRLPHNVQGVYRDNAKGPLIRVIWPSPTNNAPVTQAGTYTIMGTVPGTDFKPKATVTVKSKSQETLPKRQLESFSLGSVILNQDEQGRDTQFMKNRDKFFRTLAATNPDRFLFNFRDAFGQPQPEGARALGGWDSQTTRLRGHASGHYLSAIAQAYASTTYDEALHANFLGKMNYMIDTLYALSQKSGAATNEGAAFNADPAAVPTGPGKSNYDSDLSAGGIRTDYWNWGKGFVSAYPPDQFIMLEKGATYGGRNNQIWAPYYTLHKILAGLLDCYEVGGNKKALEIAEGMGHWVYGRLKVVPPETRISMWNRYIAGEYGGMNEVLARLYRITNDKTFMDCAKLFDNVNFFYGDAQHTGGLVKNVDTLRGRHANQHIPQITGALEEYRDTHEGDYYFIADNFWDIATSSYMYSIGGVAGAKNPNNAECFTAHPDSLATDGFARGGQNETCATYNMLKLSRQLFMFDPDDAHYMDYYEQAMYNDILASVAEDNPGNTYHIPLNPAARKQFGNARMDGFTCCNGTALESNTKLQDSIYFHSADNEALYVNLYVPSTLTWSDRKVKLTQRTDFPYADTTKLTINGGGNFDINVRVPKWATHGFFVKVNGREEKLEAKPGTYLTLKRNWKDGDTIELRMPFSFHLSPVMDQPNLASLFYGPILLAAQEPEPLSTWRKITLNGDDLAKTITGDPHALHFKVGDVEFKPFYESYARYSVYLDVTLE
jgi:DUF1680 family protein